MSLRDAATKVKAEQPVVLCKVGRLRATMSQDDQDWLDDALADPNEWKSLTLATLLAGEGYPVSDAVIRKHRTGGCPCAR